MSKLITGIMLVASLMVYQSSKAESISVSEAVKSAFLVHPSMTVARAGYHQALGQRLINLSPDPASVSIEYGGMQSGASLDTHEEKFRNEMLPALHDLVPKIRCRWPSGFHLLVLLPFLTLKYLVNAPPPDPDSLTAMKQVLE